MSSNPDTKLTYSQFDPIQLGEYIAHLHENGGRKHFVTFLIGAGCSKSAGIPLAGEIVRELREEAKTHPLLRNAGRIGCNQRGCKKDREYVSHVVSSSLRNSCNIRTAHTTIYTCAA